MKQARSFLKRIRVSPQKARLVADIVRGMDVNKALFELKINPAKAATPLYKTLRSAVANAENNMMLSRENLKVVEVRVDEGPRYKRSVSRNKGGRHPILKRTSHFTVVVGSE